MNGAWYVLGLCRSLGARSLSLPNSLDRATRDQDISAGSDSESGVFFLANLREFIGLCEDERLASWVAVSLEALVCRL